MRAPAAVADIPAPPAAARRTASSLPRLIAFFAAGLLLGTLVVAGVSYAVLQRLPFVFDAPGSDEPPDEPLVARPAPPVPQPSLDALTTFTPGRPDAVGLPSGPPANPANADLPPARPVKAIPIFVDPVTGAVIERPR
jgi:hypothetical protein